MQLLRDHPQNVQNAQSRDARQMESLAGPSQFVLTDFYADNLLVLVHVILAVTKWITSISYEERTRNLNTNY